MDPCPTYVNYSVEETIECVEEQEKELTCEQKRKCKQSKTVVDEVNPYFEKIIIEPKLAFMKHFNCEDIAQSDPIVTMNKFPSHWNEDTKCICFQLLKDTVRYCRRLQLSEIKVLTFLEIFFSVFHHFVELPTLTTTDSMEFFKEIMLRHSVQDPPVSLEVLTLEDDRYLISFFEDNILPNLMLLRAISTTYSIIHLDFNQ